MLTVLSVLSMEREKVEIDRFHNLTEEERRAELRNSGKVITNKASKGKYKFLQKYYHRGAFFMVSPLTPNSNRWDSRVRLSEVATELCVVFQDEEENVYKRDFSAPTLEDHFNKTILPKVMQVSCRSCDHVAILSFIEGQ